MRVFCDSIRGEAFFATVQGGFFATVSTERVFCDGSTGFFCDSSGGRGRGADGSVSV